MLKSTASILESFSAVAVMVIFLLMVLTILAGCCLGSVVATEFVRVMQTPIPY